MKQGTLVLLCGLPGAGKSTLAKKLAQEMPAIIMCPDEECIELGISLFDEKAKSEVEANQWRQALKLAKKGQNVVLENGFWSRQERDKLRKEAHTAGLKIKLIYLKVTLDELWRRVEERNVGQNIPEAAISYEHMKDYSSLFQPPTAAEIRLFD